MPLFKCWSPECEDETAASLISQANAKYAAEECAEEIYKANAGEGCDTIEVHVRDAEGELTRWVIRPEYEVSFYAKLLK